MRELKSRDEADQPWWVMLDPALAQRSHIQLDAATLQWDDIRTTVDPSTIRRLRLRVASDNRGIAFPSVVRALPNLEELAMPASFAPMLRSEDVPRSVVRLSFNEEGPLLKGPTVARASRFEHVKSLSSVTTPLRYDPESFPMLTELELKLDAKRTMLSRLEHSARLRAIKVGPLSRASELQLVVALNPGFLGVMGGTLDDLSPLSKCSPLRRLWLHSLTRAVSLSALRDLPHLDEIEILYSSKLSDLEAMLQLKSLRKLRLIGCKVDVRPIAPALKALNLEELTVTGCRFPLYRLGPNGGWSDERS